jgi:hypothetical protein
MKILDAIFFLVFSLALDGAGLAWLVLMRPNHPPGIVR